MKNDRTWIFYTLLFLPIVLAAIQKQPAEFEDAESEKYFKDKVITFHNVKIQNNYKEENITFDRSSKPKVNSLNVRTDLEQDVVKLEHLDTTTTTENSGVIFILPVHGETDDNSIDEDVDMTPEW